MSKVFGFIKSLFLIDLLKGLWVTLKYTPQPAFTFQYPAERRPTAPRFRGVLDFGQDYAGTGIAVSGPYVYWTGQSFFVGSENGVSGSTRPGSTAGS